MIGISDIINSIIKLKNIDNIAFFIVFTKNKDIKPLIRKPKNSAPINRKIKFIKNKITEYIIDKIVLYTYKYNFYNLSVDI